LTLNRLYGLKNRLLRLKILFKSTFGTLKIDFFRQAYLNDVHSVNNRIIKEATNIF